MKTALLILAIEILLPGGTLLALALLWYRRRKDSGQPMSIQTGNPTVSEPTHIGRRAFV
jgi:hypothetical protein